MRRKLSGCGYRDGVVDSEKYKNAAKLGKKVGMKKVVCSRDSCEIKNKNFYGLRKCEGGEVGVGVGVGGSGREREGERCGWPWARATGSVGVLVYGGGGGGWVSDAER